MELKDFTTMLMNEVHGLLEDADLQKLTEFESFVAKKIIYNESFVNFAFLLLAKTVNNKTSIDQELENALRDTRAILVKSIDEISRIATNIDNDGY